MSRVIWGPKGGLPLIVRNRNNKFRDQDDINILVCSLEGVGKARSRQMLIVDGVKSSKMRFSRSRRGTVTNEICSLDVLYVLIRLRDSPVPDAKVTRVKFTGLQSSLGALTLDLELLAW